MTGSAIAIPLLGAASANAADGTTWDKVAECESGGAWSADTGNGFFGGLQISQDAWDDHGGQTYAETPDQASRSQQIAVAEKILADQGTTPWATCALLSGLTADSDSVGVDTGVDSDASASSDSSGTSASDDSTDTAESDKSGTSSDASSDSNSDADADDDGTGDSSASSDSSTADPDATASPSSGTDAKGGDSTKSGKSDKSASSGSSDADESPVEAAESDGTDNSSQSGSSWSLVDTGAVGGGKHRGGSAEETGASGASTNSTGRHAYTVREGDSLASIADSLEVDGGWHALYSWNKDVIGSDPDHIAPGQTLEVGGETAGN